MFDDLNIRIERDVSLGPKTWYGVGGCAQYLAHPASIAQLAELVARCNRQQMPMYVLGSGANLLVRDCGVRGMVIQLDDPAFAKVQIDDNIVTVGGGFDLMKLVLLTAKQGLGGLEGVTGIPASVGGAVRMNAGGTYGDIGGCVRRVQVMSETAQVYHRDRDDLVFSYRSSNIIAPFILQVEFELEPQDPDEVMRRVKEIFLYKKNSQPMADRSAGCAFKNPPPEVSPEISPSSLKPQASSLPSAGSLIDRAGLKGYRVGGASVSNKHANFIITHDQCKADDVLLVMDHVREVVKRQSGIELKREVVVWP